MKKVNELVEKVNLAEAQGKTYVSEALDSGLDSTTHDHIDAINQLFAELELAYHNQFHKAYSQPGSLDLAKKYWLECLSPFSPEVIIHATRQVVTHEEYLPSVPKMVKACENTLGQFGLPSVRDAYLEACNATTPKVMHNWSHPAVYLAGKSAGWFELANQPEASILPIFENYYRTLCQRVLYGEKLTIPQQPALPDSVSSQLSPEENKARMAELRNAIKEE